MSRPADRSTSACATSTKARPTTADNRNVRGFDPTAALDDHERGEGRLRGAPDSAVPPSAFHVRGGLLFADSQPRLLERRRQQLAAARRPRLPAERQDRAAGGVGIYTVPFVINGVGSTASRSRPRSCRRTTRADVPRHPGQSVPRRRARPSGLVPRCQHVPRTAARSIRADGIVKNGETRAGRRHAAGVAGPGSWRSATSAARAGTHDRRESESGAGAVPLDLSRSRDQATINFLTPNVTNPFADCCPAPALNRHRAAAAAAAAVPAVHRRPELRFDGTTIYHSFQSRVERRFTQGYTLLFAYTLSSFKNASRC